MMSHTLSRQKTPPKMLLERVDSGSRAGAILPQLWLTPSAPSQMTKTMLEDSKTIIQETKKVARTRRSRRVAALLKIWRSKQSNGLPARHLELITMKMRNKMSGLERSMIRDILKLKTQN